MTTSHMVNLPLTSLQRPHPALSRRKDRRLGNEDRDRKASTRRLPIYAGVASLLLDFCWDSRAWQLLELEEEVWL